MGLFGGKKDNAADHTPIASREHSKTDIAADAVKLEKSLPEVDHDEALQKALSAAKLEVGDYNKSQYALAPNGQLISLTGNVSDLISTAAGEGIPQRGGKIWNRDDWLPIKGEGYLSYIRRLIFEGHTVFDAWLITANCVGQVVLTNPWALYSSGVASGGTIWLMGVLMGLWTTWNYLSLYLEYKRDKIKDGSWWDTNGEHKYVSQWFDVAGHHLGPWAKYLAMCMGLLTLTGAATVQTVASANIIYSVNTNFDKRTWSLIIGGSMCMTVILTPKFTKFRLATLIGLFGTFFAAVYGIAMAHDIGPLPLDKVQLWPVTPNLRPGTTPVQNFFNGAVIQLGEASGHALIIESLESMENPQHYLWAYGFGLLYVLFVTAPHSFALNFSKYGPKLNFAQNMYALFPVTAAKIAGVAAMQTHNYIAYLLWGTQFCIIAEKLAGIHTKPYWMRALLRVPFALFWLFLALVIPFYGTINTLISSLGGQIVSFVLLSAGSIKLYRHAARRERAPLPPFKFLRWNGWVLVHAVNVCIALFFIGFTAMSFSYAVIALKLDYKNWGFIPACYLCPPKP